MNETSIYVSDHLNYRIQKFDINGNFLLKWGTLGDGDVALKGESKSEQLEESPS